MERDTEVGLICLTVGILAILFRNSYARIMVDFQNKVWGFSFGEREVTASKVGIIIVSVVLIVMGSLSLLKIIHFKC